MQRASDTMAATYAAHLLDTCVESALELAVVDAFAAAVTSQGQGAPVLDAGCGRVG